MPGNAVAESVWAGDSDCRLVAEHSSDIISRYTPEGVCLYVSPACRRILGYEPDELIGKSGYETFVRQEDQARAKEARAAIDKGAGTQIVTAELRRKDGRSVWVETTARPLRNPTTGAFEELVCVTRDIEGRRQAELDLRASEERYRILFDDNPQPMYAFDMETLKFLAVNAAAINKYGYSRKEFLGMKATQLRPPEDVPRFLGDVANADPKEFSRGEWRHRTKDGKLLDVEVFGRVVQFAGRRAGLCLLHDITARKEAEAKLCQSEEMARSLVENAPAFILTLTPDGTVLTINRTNPGRDAGQIVGRNILELTPPESWETIRCAFRKVAETGRSESVEAAGLSPGGNRGWYRARLGPIKADGRVAGLMVIASDVTEERRVADELHSAYEELERRSGELAQTVETLHAEMLRRERTERELRVSRRRLRGLSTRLLSIQEEERRRIAREVHDELGQALTAIKMEVAAAQRNADSGRPGGSSRQGALNELIDGTIGTIRRIATDLRPGALDDLGLVAALEGFVEEFAVRAGLNCELHVWPEEIVLDSTLATTVFRVVQEALTNVARHANATRVLVDLRKGDDRLRLRVRDDGRGITRREVAAVGSLGLVGIRERVRLCGGTVRISGAARKGTQVVVKLPLGDRAAGASEVLLRRPAKMA